MKRISLCVSLFLVSVFAAQLSAATVSITTDTTVTAGDTSLDNQDVIVDGAVLTIDGPHTLTSLSVINGGVVTHSRGEIGGVDITASSISIAAGSKIDVKGKGMDGLSLANRAGGYHGGGSGSSSVSYPAYGSYLQPTTFGIGGHCSSGTHYGGGKVKIVADSLTIDGDIIADGDRTYRCAGSSGGSVWIDVGHLNFNGLITALGSSERTDNNFYTNAGGGAGGRVAVYYDTVSGVTDLKTKISFGGGSGRGHPAGEHGSVYMKQKTVSLARLRTSTLDSDDAQLVIPSLLEGALEGEHLRLEIATNSFIEANADAFTLDNISWEIDQPLDIASLTLKNGSTLTHAQGDEVGVNITAMTISIESGSKIDVKGKGKDGLSLANRAGGYHGGGSGSSSVSYPAYGSYLQPTTFGIGGHCSSGTQYGGGKIKIVADILTIDGDIVADGDRAYRCAGSSGGSVWIDVGHLNFNGLISALGSSENTDNNFYTNAGGGAGGRVAVYYDTVSGVTDLKTKISFGGGSGRGHPAGEHGSVYMKQKTASLARLRTSTLDSDDAQLVIPALLSGDLKGEHLRLEIASNSFIEANADEFTFDNISWTATHPLNVASVSLVNNSTLTHARGDDGGVEITAAYVSIAAGSEINVVGKGTDGLSLASRAGGYHGGSSGSNSELYPAYGSYLQPTTFGIGGHCSSGTHYGGGKVKIVAGSLIVDGEIVADGERTYRCAGSSGGSVWIDAGQLTLNGLIKASGASEYTDNNFYTNAGGGAGGRVAVYYDTVTGVTDLKTKIYFGGGSGRGHPAGEHGSVYMNQKTASLARLRTSTLNSDDARLVISSLLSGELKGEHLRLEVASNSFIEANADAFVLDNISWEADQPIDVASVTLRNNSTLSHLRGNTSGLDISATSLTIESGSSIDVTGKGLSGSTLPSQVGGSYGGLGGKASIASVYGSETSPMDLGTGGHCLSGELFGGGLVKIASQVLQIDGAINANGAGQTYRCAGSAGGTVFLEVGAILGSGLISANGQNGVSASNYSAPGGGGGGRIAVYYSDASGYDLNSITVSGGTGNGGSGQAGTLFLLDAQQPPYVIASVPTEGENVATNINSVTFNFLSQINPTTFTTEDVRVVADHPLTVVSVIANSSFEYSVLFDLDLPDGDYQFTIGPDIRVDAGFQMDQDQDGIDGEPIDDAFVLSFSIDNSPPAQVQINDFDLAPTVNQINSASITVTGTRPEDAAIELDGTERVAYGSGAFSIENVVLAQGNNQLELVAVDQAGNESQPVTLLFFVDSEPPTITGYTPTGQVSTVPNAITVSATDAGGLAATSSISLVRNSIQVPGNLQINENSLVFTPSVPLTEGNYTVSGSVLDGAGNSSSVSHSFVLDYTPPAAPVVDAVPAVVNTASLLINGNKEANTAIHLDGTSVVANNGGLNWSTTVTLAEGDNTLSFTAVDVAGNVSDPTLVDVRFDDTAPGEVNLSAPNLNGDGLTLTLNWPTYNEFANGNDIASYRIYREATSFSDVSGLTEIASVPGGTFEATIADHPRGIEQFYAVVAVDQQGLFTAAVSASAYTPVDVEAPVDITNLNVVPGGTTLDLSWAPSSDSAGDLAEYKVYVTSSGSTTSQALDATTLVGVDPISYQVTGLTSASANNILVVAVDGDGNESTGLSNPGVTLLANPANLQVVAYSGRVDLAWQASTPTNLVQQYNIYAETTDFTSVVGLSPKRTVAASNIESGLAGLTDGTTYYFAVTAVNLSNGEAQAVATVAATPEEDDQGPLINSVSWVEGATTVALDGATLTKDGHVTLDADDQAGLGRAELRIDGVLVATDNSAANGYVLPITLFDYSDGSHTFEVSVFDTLENDTAESYIATVTLAAPDAPQITAPTADLTTNEADLNVTVESLPNTEVNVFVNDVESVSGLVPLTVNNYLANLTLSEGANAITAEAYYPGRGGNSARSAAVNVTLDTTIPDAPVSVTAVPRELGQITIRWQATTNADNPVAVDGFNIYRSESNFGSINDAGVTKLNSSPVSDTTYIDLPIPDGEYFFAVTAVNDLGTESEISNVTAATADSLAPSAVVSFTPSGTSDPESGRVAPGIVDIAVTFSEALRNDPYFALVPDGGLPTTVDLTKTNQGSAEEPVYVGQFIIESTTPSGLAYVVMSSFDEVGNRGTEVTEGSALLIDTQGPELALLQLNPSAPINNDPDGQGQGRIVEIFATLNDDLATGTEVLLVPQIEGIAIAPYDVATNNGVVLTLDTQQSSEGAPLYVGQFQLPTTAGETDTGVDAAETLSFAYLAIDDLGNQTSNILGGNQYQVYQGDLPPLAVPFGLAATALNAGQVELTWEKVENAASYRLYRQGPGDTEFTLLIEQPDNADARFVDGDGVALADGVYQYTISSVRSSNGQEGESTQSEPVSVSADATPPGVPTDLELTLTPYGIQATWNAPTTDANGDSETSSLTYKLYRLSLEQGQEAGIDVSGVTPIKDNVLITSAVDQMPSEDDHMYVVTARDEAGNESDASLGEYLNFGLLPVANLSLVLPENGFPQLTWQHSGTAISGFNVSRLQPTAVQLNSGPINLNSYTDTSYNNGNAVDGAPLEQVYRVVAVDSSDVESLVHDIPLLALSVAIEDQQTLLRGVMNELRFRVVNLGSSSASNLTLEVTIDDDGEVRRHQSLSFDVAAGGFTSVPVVVGGYPSLLGSADLNLTIVQAPNPGDEVRIEQSDSVAVGDAAIVATLATEDFTRGATGTARIRIENTSDVEIEVVTAQNSGQADSPEARLQLVDEDENVLSIANINQAVGSNVLTLANGNSVARIPAGESWESAPITITVPSASPDDVTLRLALDAIHYQLGKPTQVSLPGINASRDITLVETAYFGQLDSISPTAVFGDEIITLRGTARDRDTNEALPFVPLTAILTVDGFEKTYPLYPNENGEFTFQFDPGGQTGVYTVAVLHPSIQDRPNHGQFTVSGAGVSPSIFNLQLPRNFTQNVDVRVSAGAATTLENATLQFVSDEAGGPIPSGLTVSLSNPLNLADKQSGFVKVTITGDNTAPTTGQLIFDVVADNVAEPIDQFTLNYTLVEVGPAMFPSPTILETGLARESQVTETLTFKNNGLDVLQNGVLSLIDPNGGTVPDWIQLVTLPELGNVAIGEEVEVQVRFTPDANVAEANYLMQLQVVGDNMAAIGVPIAVAVTQSGVGGAFFHASDIYTATLDNNGVPVPGLAGAKIKLQNELVLTEVFEGITDQFGEYTFQNIPAGRYTYRATAFDHDSVTGRIEVKPGVTLSEEVFLFNQIISVSFSVREITLEDRYEINLDATFETDVPVAVVMLEPLQVNLPAMEEGDVFYGELQLTNYGLIRAYDVLPSLPNDTALSRFELLSEIPDALEAGESVTLSYRVIALSDFEPGLDGDATGGACASSEQRVEIVNTCECTNGVLVTSKTSSKVSFTSDSCSRNEVTNNFLSGIRSTTVDTTGFSTTTDVVTQVTSSGGAAEDTNCEKANVPGAENDDAELQNDPGANVPRVQGRSNCAQ